MPPYVAEKTKMVKAVHETSFQKAYRAGIKIAMGTDSGMACREGVSNSTFYCMAEFLRRHAVQSAWQQREGARIDGGYLDVISVLTLHVR